jgi:hypothetical protein
MNKHNLFYFSYVSFENRMLTNADESRYFHSSWCAAPMLNSFVNVAQVSNLRVTVPFIVVCRAHEQLL